MRPGQRLQTVLLVFALTATSFGVAAPLPVAADSISDQLARLRAQEASQRANLDQLAGQQRTAQAVLAALRAQSSSSQADFATAAAEAQQLSDSITRFRSQEALIQAAHDDRRRAFAAQMRGMYKTGPLGTVVYLFSATNFGDLLDRASYVVRIARFNLAEAERLRQERDALADQRRHTEALQADLTPLLQTLEQKAAAASAAVAAQAAVFSGVEAQQRQALQALQGTRAREHQLEAALAAAEAEAAAAAQKGNGRVYGAVCPAAPAGQVVICGHGWGHGVGLAQYGALGMAQAGIGWQQILGSFYSGTSLAQAPDQTMRVYLTGAGSTITALAAGVLEDASGGKLAAVTAGTVLALRVNPDHTVQATWSGGSVKAAPLRLVPTGAAAPGFQVSGSNLRYRGEAWADGGSGLKVINHVAIEDYLLGLGEVPSSWPFNAIAAQVVAARTYALDHIGSTGVFDVYDTTQSQVYNGFNREAATQTQAVAATRGVAVFYQGQLISAVYSSSDGGHSQCASAEWGSTDNPCSPPYLRGVIDNYDVSPLHTWYTPPHRWSEIQGYLASIYDPAQCGTLTGLDLHDRDASDRLNHVIMVGSKKTCSATPGAFIRAINAGSPPDFIVYGEMFGTSPGNRAWPYW